MTTEYQENLESLLVREVMGELTDAEQAVLSAALAKSPELKVQLDQMRAMIGLVESGLNAEAGAEPVLSEARKLTLVQAASSVMIEMDEIEANDDVELDEATSANGLNQGAKLPIKPVTKGSFVFSRTFKSVLALAAVLAVCVLVIGLMVPIFHSSNPLKDSPFGQYPQASVSWERTPTSSQVGGPVEVFSNDDSKAAATGGSVGQVAPSEPNKQSPYSLRGLPRAFSNASAAPSVRSSPVADEQNKRGMNLGVDVSRYTPEEREALGLIPRVTGKLPSTAPDSKLSANAGSASAGRDYLAKSGARTPQSPVGQTSPEALNMYSATNDQKAAGTGAGDSVASMANANTPPNVGEWRDNPNSQAALITDRTSVSGSTPKSIWVTTDQLTTDWKGNVVWGENHAEFVTDDPRKLADKDVQANTNELKRLAATVQQSTSITEESKQSSDQRQLETADFQRRVTASSSKNSGIASSTPDAAGSNSAGKKKQDVVPAAPAQAAAVVTKSLPVSSGRDRLDRLKQPPSDEDLDRAAKDAIDAVNQPASPPPVAALSLTPVAAPKAVSKDEASPTDHADPQIDSLLKQANDLRRGQKYNEALKLIDQALVVAPNNVPAGAMKEMVEEADLVMKTRMLESRRSLMIARHSVKNVEVMSPYMESPEPASQVATGLPRRVVGEPASVSGVEGGGSPSLFGAAAASGNESGDKLGRIEEAIQTTVGRLEDWASAGSSVSSLREFDGRLIVTATEENQDQVAQRLSQLHDGKPIKVQRTDVDEAAYKEEENVKRGILKKLDTSMSVDFNATKFSDVMAMIQKQAGTPIDLEWQTLEQAGISKDQPITLQLANAPAAKVMKLVLQQISPPKEALNPIGFSILSGRTVVSTERDLIRSISTRIYDLREIFGNKTTSVNAEVSSTQASSRKLEQLEELIQTSVGRPEDWSNGDESYNLHEIDGRLMIQTTPELQAQIHRFLTQLSDGADIKVQLTPDDVAQQKNNEQVMTALRKKVSIDFKGKKLSEVFDSIRASTGVNFIVDWKSLQQAGIEPSQPITLSRDNMSAREALEAVIHQVSPPLEALNVIGMNVVDGVVSIAPEHALHNKNMVIRVYDVRSILSGEAQSAPNAPPPTSPPAPIIKPVAKPVEKKSEKADDNAGGLTQAMAAMYQIVAPPVNPWVMTQKDALSTFSLQADTASYAMARDFLRRGYVPPAGVMRMEEFINAMDYNYPRTPDGGAAFGIYSQGALSPFHNGEEQLKGLPGAAPAVSLVKIGIKGRVVGRDGRKASNLVFAIDTSGSMATQDRLPLVVASIKMLVAQLDPADRISIVTFSTHATLVLEDIGADQKEKISQALDAIHCQGSTNMVEGLGVAYDIAARHFASGHVNHVILCTDGVANIGDQDADAVLAKVADRRVQGISITTVGVGGGAYNDQMLDKLAHKGDGAYVFLDSLDEAKRVFVDNLSATLQTIAYDAKIQVEFNPKVVRRFRLVGYESRALKHEDFRNDAVQAGEIGSGQSATALYEVELLDPTLGDGQDLGTVYVRYKDADTKQVRELSHRLRADMVEKKSPGDPRFVLAACAAEYSELLRKSPYATGGSYARIATALRNVCTQLPLDTRAAELLWMVETTAGLESRK